MSMPMSVAMPMPRPRPRMKSMRIYHPVAMTYYDQGVKACTGKCPFVDDMVDYVSGVPYSPEGFKIHFNNATKFMIGVAPKIDCTKYPNKVVGSFQVKAANYCVNSFGYQYELSKDLDGAEFVCTFDEQAKEEEVTNFVITICPKNGVSRYQFCHPVKYNVHFGFGWMSSCSFCFVEWKPNISSTTKRKEEKRKTQ